MVKLKHEMLKNAIARTKRRIKHHEKHGNGTNAMEDKQRLKLQEKRLSDLNA